MALYHQGHILSHAIASLRNGLTTNRMSCTVHRTEGMFRFLQLLRKHSMIYGYVDQPQRDRVVVYLRYRYGKSVMQGLVQASTPGRRQYVTGRNIHSKRRIQNVSIISFLATKQGLKVFEQQNPNFVYKRGTRFGELLCTVW